MSKLHIALVAAAATFTAAAQAQEVSYDPLAAYSAGSLARAEVHAQAVAALKSGQIEFGEAPMPAKADTQSTLTRAHVQAEAREARRLGVLQGGEVTVQPTSAEIAAINAAGVRADDTQVAAS